MCPQTGAARVFVRPQEQLAVPPSVSRQHLRPQDGRGQRGRAHLRPHQAVQQPRREVRQHRAGRRFSPLSSRLLVFPQVYPSVRQLLQRKEEEEEKGGGEEKEGEEETMEGAGGGGEGQQRERVHGGVHQLAEGPR